MEADVAYVPSKVGYKKRYLLCSDGLTDMVTNEGIEGILSANKDPKRAAELLIEEACRLGGRDNVTVAVIDVCPANKLTKFFKNSFVKAVLSILIAAAVGFGAWTLLKPEPVPAGLDLSTLTQQIDNAKDYQEALKGAEDAVKTQRDYIVATREYADGKAHDNVKISEKRTALYGAVDALETAVNTYEEAVNKIKEDTQMTEEDKMNAIKNLSRKEYEDAYTACETAKKELGDAWNEYASWSEKQESKEKTAEKTKAPEKNNNGNKSGSKPADSKPADSKPADSKPADSKPADSKPQTESGKTGTVQPTTPKTNDGTASKADKSDGSGGSGGSGGTKKQTEKKSS